MVDPFHIDGLLSMDILAANRCSLLIRQRFAAKVSVSFE